MAQTCDRLSVDDTEHLRAFMRLVTGPNLNRSQPSTTSTVAAKYSLRDRFPSMAPSRRSSCWTTRSVSFAMTEHQGDDEE